ncbi:PQQ-binding-like beta-propeller repeat protein [Pseudohaliea sp.]|uniref:outer membrane protein assembly factor BamB family protein n=1 Tax=Pseudohaliea sp. TaxID=2740289 RepID=UPI0032ED2DB6
MKGADHPWHSVPWNSIHGDSHNADAPPYPTAARYSLSRRSLTGSAVLFGPSLDGDGRLFSCSGRGEGSPHLHCLNADGATLWESEPWRKGGDALGPRACPFAPLLDSEGGVYVADEKAFWCFEAGTGTVRWRTALAPLGIHEGFPSAVFSPAGHVGGISLDGTALFLERASGEPAYAPLRLPQAVAPDAATLPPGIWQGLMDPATAAVLFPGFFGTAFPVTNSPAVSLEQGRIYLPAAGADKSSSRLLAFTESADGLELALSTAFEGRCSVTPSLSPDGETVYTGNHRGSLLAFDGRSGALRWRYQPAGTAASPTVGRDGTVYTGSTTSVDHPSCLSAIDPATGEARWCRSYDELAAARLPTRAPLTPFFEDPQPHAVINSVQTIGRDHLLVVLVLGYTFTAPGAAALTQPHLAVLATINRDDGSLLGATDLPDTSEAAVVLAEDGYVYTAHAALTSSVFYFGINPMLPEDYRTALVPAGGISALRPAMT